MELLENVALSAHCSLALGGPAAYFTRARSPGEVIDALRFARARGLAVAILGGGTNVVIADEGFPGLVLCPMLLGVSRGAAADGRVLVTAGAGEPWDALVERAVTWDLAGLECLSGIPGSVGATPIQNVGAYGQEVRDTIERVLVLDRETLETTEIEGDDCGFGYRDSRFRRDPARYLVLSVTFALRSGTAPTLRYAELQRVFADQAAPTLPAVRQAVLGLRRRKSMVLDATDENRRSVGSFFTNPVLPKEEADAVVTRALSLGLVRDEGEVPRYPAPGGRSKLAAGWLIEKAGIDRGLRRGSVGISSRHALALVHHGGGETRDLIELGRWVQKEVCARFGVTLVPEPVFLGFSAPPLG